MILDALLKLSAAQQVTADADSTNTIDLGNTTPKRNAATGEPLCCFVGITAAGTNTGSAKLTVIQSAAENLSSPQIIGEIDLAAADLAAGKQYKIALSAGIPPLRYLGLHYDITGTVDFTVDAFLQPDDMASIEPASYAKGYVTT